MDSAGESEIAGSASAAALFATIASMQPAAATVAARRVVLADLMTQRLGAETRRAALVGCLLADFGRVVLRLPPGEAPAEAAQVLDQVGDLRAAAASLRHRHERIDGSGLPGGLVGGEIPFGARLVALTDLLVSQRRLAPLDWDRRLEVMKEAAGGAVDAELADQAFDLLRRHDVRSIVEHATPAGAMAVIGQVNGATDTPQVPVSALVQHLESPEDMARVLVDVSWPTGVHRSLGVHRSDGELLSPVASAGPETEQWRPIAATAAMHGLDRPTTIGTGGRSVALAPVRTDHLWGIVWGVTDDPDDEVVPQIAAALSTALERHQERRRLDALAHGDQLTGLANRRRLENELAWLFSGPPERRADAALIMCDVDGLKRVNDTRGHAAGDDVLKAVARVLTDLVDGLDGLAARLGGDEFCILLRSGALLRAEGLARRATRAVRASAPSAAGLSCGIAYAAQARTPSELLSRADERQYLVKRRRPGAPARDRARHDRRRRGD
ncbi:MAG: diguanylate cyclase, partial [Actinomycetota bacterium]